MGQRWFTVAIGVMWLTSMGWLVSTKLWPLLRAGTPPSNLTVYTQQKLSPGEELPPVGWNLSWGGRPLGWAVSSSSVNSEGFTTIRSHAHLMRFPVEDFLPSVVKNVLPLHVGRIDMDAECLMVMDAEGRLKRTSINISTPESDKTVLRAEGHLKDDKFYITLLTSRHDEIFRWPLPADQLIGNDLMPLVRLPDLHLDQTWNVRVFSSLAPSKNANLEVVQAKVERSDVLHWEETERRVWLVVLRCDSLLGRAVRGKMWVDQDGTILQQESYIGNSKLTSTRVHDSQAKKFYQQCEELRLKRLKAYDIEEFDPSSVPEDKVVILPIIGEFTDDGRIVEPPRRGHGRHHRYREGRNEPSLQSSEAIWDRAWRAAQKEQSAEAAAEPPDDNAELDSEEQERGPLNSPSTKALHPPPAVPAQP